jgi:sugar/nucleoside kinase (ribokinase family)
MKPELVVVGHVMEEIIRFPHRTVGPFLGGVAAYFSVIATKLGARTGIVTKIGTDMPRHLFDPLYEAGVDTRGIKTEGSESRHSLLIYDESGNKTMQYPQKGKPITFQDIPEEYFTADIIYIAPEEEEIPFSVIERLSSLEKKLAVDLGGYGGAHCSEHTGKSQDKLLRQILPYFYIAKLSREDCQYLFPNISFIAEKMAKILVEWGAKVGIVTLAEKGAVIATHNDVFMIPVFTQSPLDCTGAGDAFAAGFLFSYHQEKNVKKAGLFATATSSLVIEKTGGIALERMPFLSEVKERVSEFPENISL